MEIRENQKVKFITGSHNGQTGTVTRVKGPKTVEVKMDAGFMLWNVKVSQLEFSAAELRKIRDERYAAIAEANGRND